MSDAENQSKVLPSVSCVKIPEQGDPYLEGYHCKECNAVYTRARAHCASCFARNSVRPYRLANTGNLYTYSIVHRTFPGVEVPFISAVVDLDGGGTLKGNLINVEPKAENIEFGMPVKVVFADSLGRKDKEGNSYLSYFFTPV